MSDETYVTPGQNGTEVTNTKKIDWVRKLTSRKFWLAVVGFVTPLCIAFGMSEASVTQVTAIIMAGATLIAYVIGEGLVDAEDAGSVQTLVDISQDHTVEE